MHQYHIYWEQQALALHYWFAKVAKTGNCMRYILFAVLLLSGCTQDVPQGQTFEPIQDAGSGDTWEYKSYTIESLASYSVQARVMGVKQYSSDDGADLAPIDFALGWEEMADPAIYKPLNIRQSNRWYRYSWGAEGPPIPAKTIARLSANTHLIPKNDQVADQLDAIEEDQIVLLEGDLVKANGPKGYRWKSSLTRSDTGANSCELMWVEKVTIIN